MYENDMYTDPREAERIRRAKAAHKAKIRREKMRRRRRRQQRLALICLILTLALLICLMTVIVDRITGGQETLPATENVGTSEILTEAPTEAPTLAPTEAIVEAETMPEVTWMTFAPDRALKASQYFVYDVNLDAFLTASSNPWADSPEVVYPASITKIFTAYVAMHYLEPSEQITVGDALELVYIHSSFAGVQQGDVVSVEKLVEGLLLPSGNDAAYVLAVEIGRRLADDRSLNNQAAADLFVAEMNTWAQRLGMVDTHFANPDGLHEDEHYTSYADLVVMGKLALENEIVRKYAGTARDTVMLGSVEKEWKNTNAILNPESDYYCPYAIGLKTGTTGEAGNCLLSAFKEKDGVYIIGVFGCEESNDRYKDTRKLYKNIVCG